MQLPQKNVHRLGGGGGDAKLTHTQVLTQSISASIRRIVLAEPTEAYTAEITRSLYYLGRALYRYSLLQKERRKL